MVFSSVEFLYLYLPVTAAIYFLVPLRWRNTVLFAVSLAFYGWGEPTYLFLMLFTVAVDWACGLFIDRRRPNRKLCRAAVILAVVVNLTILGWFKYADFILANLAKIPAFSRLSPLGISLPTGISFYTFQALSYVIDLYRGDAAPQKNPLNFGLYVTLFPQLIAGPIVRYRDIDAQLTGRKHSLAATASGIRTFCTGLAKKVLLGNACGEFWAIVRDLPAENRTALAAWSGLVFFAFQIYFDFSGYSDMAIGLGKIFGFRFPENFDYPYISTGATAFWRRWHITLSTWFREYVYIPLGGNRAGIGRTLFNLFVVWSLTGLWHGAAWNFLLWGIYWFVFLAIEKLFLGKLLEKLPAAVGWLYTVVLILFGWLIFVFDGSLDSLDAAAGLDYFKNLFGSSGVIAGADGYEILRGLPLFLTASVASTPYPKRLFYRFYAKSRLTDALAAAASVVGLFICTAYLVGSAYNPFLYFKF